MPPPPPLCAGFGLAARRQADKSVATLQIANTGLISLSYLQKVSEKVSLGPWSWVARQLSHQYGLPLAASP